LIFISFVAVGFLLFLNRSKVDSTVLGFRAKSLHSLFTALRHDDQTAPAHEPPGLSGIQSVRPTLTKQGSVTFGFSPAAHD
jgi:hypothetical protein